MKAIQSDAHGNMAGNFWRVEDGEGEELMTFAAPVDVTTEAVALALYEEMLTPEPEDATAQLIAHAAARRWAREVGGIEIAGMTVHTDDRSKTLIMGARQAAEADPAFTTKFKAAGGFVTLDAAAITVISDAVLAHVADCFGREEAVLAAIEAGTIATTEEIDAVFAAAVWPPA